MQNTFVDKTFRDQKGELAIIHLPNAPLIVWLLATGLQFVFPTGEINGGLNLIAVTFLTIWSGLELLEGVNYFRKGLGAVVLVGLIVSLIQPM